MVIIESASGGHNMDTKWQTICTGLGYTATIYPQTQLDINTWFSTTDILIVSSGVINLPNSRIDTIQSFLRYGGHIYLQTEYTTTFTTNIAYQQIINACGGNFSWGGTTSGYLDPMNILGSLSNTTYATTPFPQFWYGCYGSGNGCNSYVEPFLEYGGQYFGFIFCMPTNNGRMITTSDQDWIRNNASDPLMENIAINLAGGAYACVTSAGAAVNVNLGPDTTICNGSTLTLNATTTGATSYLWSTGATTATINVSTSGTYWVQVSNGACTGSDTIVLTLGTSTSSAANVTICNNSTYTLPSGRVVSAAGTYLDTIPNHNGCDSVITTTVTVSSAAVDAGNDATICNGDSTQLNATGGLIYSWTPTTGLSNPNIANPKAAPTTTTTYTVSSQIPIGNLITNGDFSQGNTGFSSGYTYTTPNTLEGQYYVGTNAQAWNGGMASCGDHTTGSGNMMMVNGATAANVSIWCQTVNVTPNTTYAFSTWLMTLSVGNPAALQFSINGVLLGSVFNASPSTCQWQQFYTTWNSGANTTAQICVVNQNTLANANDFALDDISFATLCTATDTVRITVNQPASSAVNAAICQGQTYTRPNGTSVSTAGTYIDTLQTINGCDSIITTTLTVNPNYAYTVDQTICPHDTYVLPDGSVVSTSGTYTSHLFTSTGCDSIITTNLTIVASPLVASNDTAICLGSSAQLNVTGGLLGYAWTPAGSLNDSTLANPVATPAQTTTYIVTAKVASGNLIANGDFSNGNIGFSSAYTYTTNLYPEGTYYVGSNPNTYHSGFSTCTDHTTGTGNMMIVNGSGTANTSIWCQTINVVPNTDYAFICWGESVASGSPAQLQFSIDGGLIGPVFTVSNTPCVWQQFYAVWNSGSNTTANICIVNQNTSTGGNDFAIDDISFVGLCTASDTVVVTVNHADTVTVNATVCQGTTYTYPDGTTATSTGTNTSVLTNRFGCDSTITTNLTVNPTALTTVYDTICNGSYFTRPNGAQVNTAGTYTDTLSTTLGCDSIVVNNLTVLPSPKITVLDTICSGQTFTRPNGAVATVAGTYVDTLTTTRGCDSIVTNQLTVINIALTATTTDIRCNGTADGVINATANNGLNPFNFDLSLGGTIIDNNPTGSFNNLTPGTYDIDATDAFGCDAHTTAQVNEPAARVIAAAAVDVTCYGEADGKVVMVTTGGVTPYTYQVAGQSNTSGQFERVDTGTYTCLCTDANGCVDSTTVTVNQPQPIVITVQPDSLFVNLGNAIQIVTTSNYDPSTTYQWTPFDGLSCNNCPNPSVGTNNTRTYNVQVTATINGHTCTNNTDVTVTVIPDYGIFIPNAFTPNKDGNNDFFQLYGNLPALEYVDVMVFDRIGEMVFKSNDLNFKWDGTYKGAYVQPQVLTYVLKAVFIDGHVEKLFKGGVTLMK